MPLLPVLMISWGLGDDHKSGPVIARSGQGMGSGLGQIAGLAGSDPFTEEMESGVHNLLPELLDGLLGNVQI